MKTKNKIFPTLILFFLVSAIGCDEDEILKEVPLDFAAPENAFVTNNDFNIAAAGLYDQARYVLSLSERPILDLQYGTDLGVLNHTTTSGWFGHYPISLNSNEGFVAWHWSEYYKLISSSNIIIGRLGESELTSEQKTYIEAVSRFFRGIAYKNMAHLYGGVPIELEEVGSPKTDYTRASRQAVYEQAASDLEYAAQNLKGISEAEDWEVNDLAAYHVLAEVYLCLEQWSDAIQAATTVIDDANTALMTERFGTRTNDPGDVYWDMFRSGNQNRSSGNTEAIMVWQYEIDVLGGELEASSRSGPLLERNWAPYVGQIRYEGPDGVTPFITAPVSDYTCGRGIGRLKPTRHYDTEVWQNDWDDMRNSQYNFVRDVPFNNPESVWYGEMFLADHSDYIQNPNDTIRWFYPFPSKVSTPFNHPDGLFADKSILKLSNSAGGTYCDQYFIRLAETYLLRAEAHLENGDPVSAAADINVVRARANATPAAASEMDIDYILDERLRELGTEELRRLTLARLSLVYDRVSRYAKPTGYNDNQLVQVDGFGVEPYHNLWPIPFSEIERNTDVALEQNPGYAAE